MRSPGEIAGCPACRSPLAADQRYCLGCGMRVAAHRVPLPQRLAGSAPLAPAAPTAVRRRRRPHPRTAAALTLATLGAGVLAGSAASAGTGPEASGPVYALAPAAATPTPAPTPAAASSSLPDDDGSARVRSAPLPESPAPAAEPAAAPAPAAVPAAVGPAPAQEPTPSPEPAGADPEAPSGPVFKHVVVVSLTGQDASAFAEGSAARYLAGELAPQGAVLARYRPVATGSLANGLALLAGAEPTGATRADCPRDPGTPPADACLLEDGAASLPGELAEGARSWKAYVPGEPPPCSTEPAPGYAPARNPLAWMRLQDCATSQGGLDDLAGDFSDTDLAPVLAYVLPDDCHDGSATDCPAEPGAAGATGTAAPTPLERADAWLRETVPPLLASKAFADGGLLVVLFDGAQLPDGDDAPAAGALLVSAAVPAGVTSQDPYGPYSLARSLAAGVGVEAPGAAARKATKPLGEDVLPSQDVPNSDTTP